MCSWLYAVDGGMTFLEKTFRDENSSIAEIVRNPNSKIGDPETPDAIEVVQNYAENNIFASNRMNLSEMIKEASPQFYEDVDTILNANFKTNDNTFFVKLEMDIMVNEILPLLLFPFWEQEL